ncbi:hypothetical protein C8F04DRAFT_1088713 [Mycena alexandri]|uniref:RSE1/DDB1/CPSF1 C-terminal domain-containing protein n=1 Tax=Mycena alexandri TaxID=1745969 RepID=A0AAD6T3E0_9AGAR|nr:hypothetical protein C8F04DRAFT_1088713 [Mycena alexandri]
MLGSRIIVGDMQHSLTFLACKKAEKQLLVVADDTQSRWVTNLKWTTTPASFRRRASAREMILYTGLHGTVGMLVPNVFGRNKPAWWGAITSVGVDIMPR